MHLSVTTVASILDTGSPELRRYEDGIAFGLTCSVDGGLACRFSTGMWNDPALLPLTSRIIDDIGWKTVEHAPGHRVLIRCEAPSGDAALARSTIDRGNGAEPLPVLGEVS